MSDFVVGEDFASISKALREIRLNNSCEHELQQQTLVSWQLVIFTAFPELEQLHSKWMQRKKKDLKIPPGSQSIRLSYDDPRYVLSAMCVIRSKQLLIQREFDGCEFALRESYMWCPKSVETLYLLAEILRLTSFHKDHLDEAEVVYRKAIIAAGAIGNREVIGSAEILVNQALFGPKSGQREALFMLQSNRTADGDNMLRNMNFNWRISDKVLNYPTAEIINRPRGSVPAVTVFDNFLPQEHLLRMQHIFRSEAPFWKEHDYDEMENFSRTVGYYSYLYPFRERNARNFIEQLIDGVFKAMSTEVPELAEATTSEWWVHSRPHVCGHQMHFDSDETRIDEGGSPQHPIISCVLFVREAGGPTLMTDQTLTSSLATEGWMIDARLNRLLAFDARYLHGVIPGIGPAKEAEGRRLTFMVGFWRKIEAKDKGPGRYGAGQPFPYSSTTLQWPNEMTSNPTKTDFECNITQPCNSVRHVSPIWEQLREDSSQDYKTFFQGF